MFRLPLPGLPLNLSMDDSDTLQYCPELCRRVLLFDISITQPTPRSTCIGTRPRGAQTARSQRTVVRESPQVVRGSPAPALLPTDGRAFCSTRTTCSAIIADFCSITRAI